MDGSFADLMSFLPKHFLDIAAAVIALASALGATR